MATFSKKTSTFSKNDQLTLFIENCNLTLLEEKLVSDLHPIVKEIIENFWLKNCNTDILLDDKISSEQILRYKNKFNFVIELLEPCEIFLKNYPAWAKLRIGTCEALRIVEKHLKDLITKCHSIFQVTGPKFDDLSSLLKSSELTDSEKQIINELKTKYEKSRYKALIMCSLDFSWLHKLGAHEFYYKMTHSINNLFGADVFLEILDDLEKLIKNLPEQIDNVGNIYTPVRICVRSILPKIRKPLPKEFSIFCIILTIFLVVFINRRQHCAILIHLHDLLIQNSVEIEINKLISTARVEDSKLAKMVLAKTKKKIAYDAIDGGVTTVIDIANIVLNSIDVNRLPLAQETELVFKITNKLEKDLISYHKIFQMLVKSTEKRLKIQDVTNWIAVIIYHTPIGTSQKEIESSIKRLLEYEARNCINLERLPTNGNNWLVKIPANHSSLLLKQKYIRIAKEQCLVMP